MQNNMNKMKLRMSDSFNKLQEISSQAQIKSSSVLEVAVEQLVQQKNKIKELQAQLQFLQKHRAMPQSTVLRSINI